jgi:hypothetical protein
MTTAIDLATIAGGVTAARDFAAGGVACGIKHTSGALDLGIVRSGRRAVAAEGMIWISRVGAIASGRPYGRTRMPPVSGRGAPVVVGKVSGRPLRVRTAR